MHQAAASAGRPPTGRASAPGCRSDSAVGQGRGDQGPPSRGGAAGVVVAGEEPVLAADGDALQRPFGGIVVDVEEAFTGVGVECVPLVENVGKRLAHGTARQDDRALGIELSLDLAEDRVRLPQLLNDLLRRMLLALHLENLLASKRDNKLS